MPIVENPARITVVPSSRVCLVFQIRGKRRPYRQYQKPVDKKREPDRFPRSGSCLMTTRNRIKCATSVVPYCHIIRQCCIFVSIFLKKNKKFLKKIDSDKTVYFFVLQENTYDYVFFVSSLSASSSATRSMPTK